MGLWLPCGLAPGLDPAVTPWHLVRLCKSGQVSEEPTQGASSAPSELGPQPRVAALALPLTGGCPLSPASTGTSLLPTQHGGASFQQLASFPDLLSPSVVTQPALSYLPYFYLSPRGCLGPACLSLHMPKHLLSSASGWFLLVPTCRSESCCSLPGERLHLPRASAEECSTQRSFLVASLRGKVTVRALSCVAVSRRGAVGLVSLPCLCTQAGPAALPGSSQTFWWDSAAAFPVGDI